jgi:hypothetical protein
MPTWEANKRRTWKIRSNGNFKDFSKKFYVAVQKEACPFVKENFLRMLAESGKSNRMNSIEFTVSMRGKRLKGVV